MRHVFHPEAALEFKDAIRFYEGRAIGLGVRFASEVRAAIDAIMANPQRWRILEDDVRRYLVGVFPYLVLYTIESDYVLIIAVMHGKRHPGYWKHRLTTT